ncbi:hypothetical protein JCM6882_006153 [Rhodosporidiobolus microsporus]
MSDSEDHAELPGDKKDKEKQNEACTNCRSVKRRCHNTGDHAPCKRCTKQNLECVYYQNKRGRKAGVPIGPRPRKKRAVESMGGEETGALQDAMAATSAVTEKAPSGTDWLSDLLKHQQQSDGLAGPSTAVGPIPPQPAAYPPHVPSSSPYLSMPVAPPPSSRPTLPSISSASPPLSSFPPHTPAFSAPPPQAPSFPSIARSYAHPPPLDQPSQPGSRPLLPLTSATRASAYATSHFAPQPNGPSPASGGYPSPASGSAAAATSPGSVVQATPATGGFSLVKILKENHREPGENGATSPPRHSLADAFAPESDRRSLSMKPERVFEDIVAAGILPEEQVKPLFDFYFHHLNPMTSLLDPVLHTVDFCRDRSAILFTAILTVATKVALPTLYPPSLKYAKMLLGQAFESGVNNLELVQALATMVFWQDATEDSGARKLAYTIRCAFELNIHKKAKRPLPEDEMERRKVLNPERTWLYLTIADHRFGTQRGLPKMISNDFRYDAVPWILEHGVDFCPQEAGLVPLVELGRILDLFGVLISPEDGLPSMGLLKCLEKEVEAWRGNWSMETSSIPLQPAQASLVRFYAQVLQFQMNEVRLWSAIKRTAEMAALEQVTFDPQASPTIVFGTCIRAAIKVLDAMEREVRWMVYSFDSMWVGTASAAIWLASNLAGMELRDRQLSLEAIARLQGACTEHSTSPQSMAGYTARLLQHLLQKAKTVETTTNKPSSSNGPSTATANGAAASSVAQPAASQAPSFVTASLSAPTWSTDTNPFSVGPANGGSTAFASSTPSGLGAFDSAMGSANGTAGNVEGAAPPGADATVQQQQQKQQPQTWAGLAAPSGDLQQFDPLGGVFLTNMVAPLQSFGQDLPFPAADDAMWSSLLSLFPTDS